MVDTGTGIRKEDQDKLFKMFGFLQANSGANKTGIGLGLVICQQIVSQFDGSIKLKRSDKNGSCFTVLFNLEPA